MLVVICGHQRRLNKIIKTSSLRFYQYQYAVTCTVIHGRPFLVGSLEISRLNSPKLQCGLREECRLKHLATSRKRESPPKFQ